MAHPQAHSLLIILLLLVSIARSETETLVQDIRSSISPITGTQLYRSDGVPFSGESSSRFCEIGFVILPKAGAKKAGFISLLKLPPLMGDSYDTKVHGRELRIKRRGDGVVVATIHLDNIEALISAEN